MKNILNNLKKFFKTDIKVINSYFLAITILVILVSVGLTSYALFSYAKISNNVIEGKVGKINYTTNFAYTGSCTTYTAKSAGYYNLEVWGAQGGNYNTTYVGGLGGYSKGIVHLEKGATLYVCVGGQPQTVTTTSVAVTGGFNGGGNGFNRGYSGTYTYGQAGGGATDIRIGQNSLYARVIVAGGGSGSNNRISGYAGGGLSGISGQSGYAGTQTSAGTGGSFGQGGSATTSGSNYRYGASGGGGGFYGGGAIASYSDDTNYDKFTGGGSGYVYTSTTASSYPSGCLLNSNYYLASASTTQGTNTGNGKAKITYVGSETTNKDESGANAPVLASNMIPVYYDETNDVWKKANESNTGLTNRWYNYGERVWANAVTVTSTNRTKYLNAAPGTAIPMDDINTMWVWIPRFNAVTPSNYNGGKQAKPNAINVTFVKQNETAIDAFTFGTKSLSGFWYAKFETSHTTLSSSTTYNNLGCSNETCSNANGIIIKPNVTSLRYNSVSNLFFASRSMEQTGNSFGFVSSEVDTHVSKNNEWGAVAYLTQSIYGRCISSNDCVEVGLNNNQNYITGIGAPAGSAVRTTETTNSYNTILGKGASTTGSIYGIYDMSGGAYEYVMGMYNRTIGDSGFSSLPDEKYYNSYTGTSYTGHALTETNEWYNDMANVVNSSRSWYLRGNFWYSSSQAGIFAYTNIDFGSGSSGTSSSYDTVRMTLTNE